MKITIMDLIRSDSDLNSFTGLSKLVDLDKITEITDNTMAKLNYNVQFSLGTREHICLTLES